MKWEQISMESPIQNIHIFSLTMQHPDIFLKIGQPNPNNLIMEVKNGYMFRVFLLFSNP